MSMFIDEADVDDRDEGEIDDDTTAGPPVKRKKQTINDSDDDDDEEEDDEEAIAKEMEGFVVSGDEQDDGDQEEPDHSDKSDDDESDMDEDLDLVNENLGLASSKKRGRVRLEDDDEDEADLDDRERIEHNLFPANDPQEDLEEGSVSRAEPVHADEDDRSSESGTSERNWIVDDDEQTMQQRQKHKQWKRSHKHLPIDEEQLNEAQGLFGTGFDIEEFWREQDEDDDLEDDIDEEEEGDEEGAASRGRRRGRRDRRLIEQIEPSELEDAYLRDEDKRIVADDKPERFHNRKVPLTEVEDDDELATESGWVLMHAFDNTNYITQQEDEPDSSSKPKAEHIQEALKFLRNQHFEVPFIAFYRKEYVEQDLSINDLWKVYQWDEKWCQLLMRRTRFASLLRRMQAYQHYVLMQRDGADNPFTRCIKDEDISKVVAVFTVETLADLFDEFQLYHGCDLTRMQQWEKQKAIADNDELTNQHINLAAFRHATRKDQYQICVEAGLGNFACKFGLTPAQFGENMRGVESMFSGFSCHDVDQYPEDVSKTAEDYVCTAFPQPEDVVNGGKYMVAKQLSREPVVRDVARLKLQLSAVVHCRPTRKGMKEIDESHPIYHTKYLYNKRVKDFHNDEFLKLVQAEMNGLVELEIAACERSDMVNQKMNMLPPRSVHRHKHNVQDEDEQGVPLALYQLMINAYRTDDQSDTTASWVALRKETVFKCLVDFLLPGLLKELRMKITQEAKDAVIKDSCLKLYNWLCVGPYSLTPNQYEHSHSDRDGVRVLAIAYSDEFEQASFGAMLDGNGELIDSIRLLHMKVPYNSKNPALANNKQDTMRQLKDFVVRRGPHVIAIAGESMKALHMKRDIERAMNELSEDADEQMNAVPVEIVEVELAKMYMNSKRAKNEFPDLPVLLRCAVSVGRRLQDPLIEFCQLWSQNENEILFLNLHPLQSMINKDDLSAALQLEFINRVNEVGVDLNKCIEHAHCLPMLQFVCGLGPRKVQHLVKVIKQASDGYLGNRSKLVTTCGLGPNVSGIVLDYADGLGLCTGLGGRCLYSVFMNCAGFIRIDTAQAAERSDTLIDRLDGTRVHPETYEWARKMAIDALEYDEQETENAHDALDEIFDQPEKLKDLDLDAFAEELERQEFGNKSITLYDIRAELNNPYKDLRVAFQAPGPDQLFNMLTKESPTTFNIGKLVLGKVANVVYRKPDSLPLDGDTEAGDGVGRAPVRDPKNDMWKCPMCLRNDFLELQDAWEHIQTEGECPGKAVGVNIRLENGVLGFVSTEKLSDKVVENPSDRVITGQPVYARILRVDPKRFKADLTCCSSDLLDKQGMFKGKHDPNWDQQMYEFDEAAEQTQKKSQTNKSQYTKRVIAHPNFHNTSYKDAESMLADLDQGDVIIRPSSKGADHLTITWKVIDGIYQHVDVIEEGKENLFSLGKLLKIQNEEFEDLDEIIARYVQPMAGYVREIMTHKNFHDPGVGMTVGENAHLKRSRQEIEPRLKEQKAATPNRIPYILSPSVEYPGKFMLSYMPKRAVHEFVTVLSEGFKYRQLKFASVERMLKYFKEHYQEAPPAAVRTPAPDNASMYNFGQSVTRNGGMNTPSARNAPAGFDLLSHHSGSTQRNASINNQSHMAGGSQWNAPVQPPQSYAAPQPYHLPDQQTQLMPPPPPMSAFGGPNGLMLPPAAPNLNDPNLIAQQMAMQPAQQAWPSMQAGGRAESSSDWDTSSQSSRAPFNRNDNNRGGGRGGGAGRGGDVTCYNCNQQGHMSRECPNPSSRGDRDGGGGGQGREPPTCYNCQETGHMSRECPNPRKERERTFNQSCYNCNQPGHRANDCPEPRSDRGRGRGGGRGGGDRGSRGGGGYGSYGSSSQDDWSNDRRSRDSNVDDTLTSGGRDSSSGWSGGRGRGRGGGGGGRDAGGSPPTRSGGFSGGRGGSSRNSRSSPTYEDMQISSAGNDSGGGGWSGGRGGRGGGSSSRSSPPSGGRGGRGGGRGQHRSPTNNSRSTPTYEDMPRDSGSGSGGWSGGRGGRGGGRGQHRSPTNNSRSTPTYEDMPRDSGSGSGGGGWSGGRGGRGGGRGRGTSDSDSTQLPSRRSPPVQDSSSNGGGWSGGRGRGRGGRSERSTDDTPASTGSGFSGGRGGGRDSRESGPTESTADSAPSSGGWSGGRGRGRGR